MTITTLYRQCCLPRLRQLIYVALLILCLIGASCKKLVDIPPPSQSLAENSVYATDATAIGVLTGLYASLTNTGVGYPFQGIMSIGLLSGLSADELSMFGTSNPHNAYYKNNLSSSLALSIGGEHWKPMYNFIYKCNAAIDGLQKSTSLTPEIKQQLLGEAKFMRGFFYFYLVNLFGEVPLVITTDPEANTLMGRSSQVQVYSQIISDLKDAQDLLNTKYLDITLLNSTNERVRPNKWAATALLARTYLYTNKYDSAELYSSQVISNSLLYDTIPLKSVFLKNSKEAIWQLQPTTNDLNTADGKMYIIPSTGPSSTNNPVYLSKLLINSFEPGDKRVVLGNWVNSTIYKKTSTTFDTVPFVFKYKVATSTGVTSAGAMTEYIMVLRLAEQFLIRSEARAQQNNFGGSQADLNIIRTRAGLPISTASNKDDLLTAILNERRHELFCEWGHRWLDLKRTGKVDAVMSVVTPLKANGAQWQSYQQLYPISISEIRKAPNLEQNTGY